MYCRSWRKKSCFWMPHGPTNEQMWCQSGQCSVTIAQFPQRPTIWPRSRSLTRSTSFTGPLLTSSVSSTSNAYTAIAVSSSHKRVQRGVRAEHRLEVLQVAPVLRQRPLPRLRGEVTLRGLGERQARRLRLRLLIELQEARRQGVLGVLLGPFRLEEPDLFPVLDGDEPPGFALGALAGNPPGALSNLRHVSALLSPGDVTGLLRASAPTSGTGQPAQTGSRDQCG